MKTSHIILWIRKFIKGIANLTCDFKFFNLRIDIAHNSPKVTNSSMFIIKNCLTKFHKKILNICHKILYQIAFNLAMSLTLLGDQTVLNQMSFVRNFKFLLVKFFRVWKKCIRNSQKKFTSWFYYKKNGFSHNFLLTTSTNIYIAWDWNSFIKIGTMFLFFIIWVLRG